MPVHADEGEEDGKYAGDWVGAEEDGDAGHGDAHAGTTRLCVRHLDILKTCAHDGPQRRPPLALARSLLGHMSAQVRSSPRCVRAATRRRA